MKYLLVALTFVSLALFGGPAWAHVVQATTSVSLTDVDVNDKPELEKVLKAAVNDMIREAIAFKPTLVALTDAQVVGERLYVRVLIADEEGERTLQELSQGDERDGMTRVRI
jgi:hypothetical protein